MIDQIIGKLDQIVIGSGTIGAAVMFIVAIVKDIIESSKGE